ncbi:hypothetical protein AC623_14185 [Bacillus sp. FJAT-27231]|uniref:hypothetical protein n=1 Tax=Bacillus sp. FJAT-27231 TaxID=1679168 RepID=UPI000670EC0B|nr:hypothetical protein [Bacillus sp. FJAT-27231]KMY54940.1 hypothetical protein AC623_14185 [Bacillus sp. FJAT-27231]
MQIALEERTTGHASYANMERVIQILIETDTSNISTRGLEMLERIRTTFDFLKDTLDKADPWLVPTSTMDNINSPISQVLGEITNFNNDKNEQRLNSILSYLENLLVYLSQLVVTKTPEEIEGVRNSVIKFRQSVGQHLSYLEKDATETSTALTKNTEKLNELTSSIESQKTRIDSIVNEFQSQFLQGQTQRTEDFNIFLKKAEEDFKGVYNANTDTFDQLVSTQQVSFDSLNEGFQQQVDTQQKSFDSLIDELKAKFQSELDHIHKMNKEAEKIVGIISMKGLAHGYQKIANDEGKKAFWWNFGSIGSMIAVIVFGVFFLLMHEGSFDWTTLVSRIVLTGIGLTLFTYCAKQATNHRNEERRNRKIELELASLDPYIKDLDTNKQKEVKENLVEKYFGVELPNVTTHQAPVQQQNITDTIANNPQIMQLIADKVSQLITKQ